jgi:hypothetical protein
MIDLASETKVLKTNNKIKGRVFKKNQPQQHHQRDSSLIDSETNNKSNKELRDPSFSRHTTSLSYCLDKIRSIYSEERRTRLGRMYVRPGRKYRVVLWPRGPKSQVLRRKSPR